MFTLAPTVHDMLMDDSFARCIVGPLGSGKSSGCVLDIANRAVNQKPGFDGVRRTRFAVVRNSYGQLRDTTRKTFEQWVPPILGGTWHEQPFIFEAQRKLRDGTRIHSEVLFRAMDRPDDVRKILSLELTGAYCNELREMAKEVFDGLQGRVGRYPSQAQGGASWFGVSADTNPWSTSSWGYQLFSKDRPPGFRLFEQPDGLGPDAENLENLPPGYYERLCHGKDADWIAEYLRAQYPSADRGSIYGELIDALERRGGVGAFEHGTDGVDVTLDLGVSDATALWFTRHNANRSVDFIDWHEETGKGMPHFFKVIDERGYKIRRVFLPHDARQRSFQTGVSTIQQFEKHFGAQRVTIGPELSVADGIAAGRWLLEQPCRFHSRCAEGLKRLRAYRYVWDEAKKVFSKTPLHDWTSHTADSYRGVALVAHANERLTRPQPEPQVEKSFRSLGQFNLEELFEANKPQRGRGRL